MCKEIDPVEEELERIERTEITQPAHLIIQDLLLKTYHYIHTGNYTKASLATKKLSAEICKYLGMRGVVDISSFCREFNWLMGQYGKSFSNHNWKKQCCHKILSEIEIKMSKSGFDFIVIMGEIKTEGDVKRAIKGILTAISAIDPYFELKKDIGTAEVLKQNLRKLDKLLSMLSGSEDFMKVVFAVRRGIEEYDKIMSTVITSGISLGTATEVIGTERGESAKTKPSKTYLDVKASFGDLLGILKIVLERPESSKFFKEELEKMEVGEGGRPMMPFRLFFGSMTPAE